LFDEDGAGIERWGVGSLRGSIPSNPLYCAVEVFNCVFNVGVILEWNKESKVRGDEVAEIAPVGFAVT
jgi:hypothetical protein